MSREGLFKNESNMPAPKLQPLSKGKCLGDLKAFYDSYVFTKNQSIPRLCNSALKLLEAAKAEDRRGNQEESFILFMRYLNVISYVQKSDEYKRKISKNEPALSKDSMDYAINSAERLSESLKQRYQQQENLSKPKAVIIPSNSKPDVVVDNAENGIPYAPTLPDVSLKSLSLEDGDLSCMQLYKILEKNPSSVLVIDVRSVKEFIESHIKHDCCISIPEEILSPGCSASKLAEKLPADSKPKWGKRVDVEHLVLMDWFSSASNIQPDSPIQYLHTIIVKWDPGVKYRSKPFILKGGYEEWLSHYPMYCTNAKPELPTQIDDELLDIDDVTYPELFDETPKFSRANKPGIKENALSNGKGTSETASMDSQDVPMKENIESNSSLLESKSLPLVQEEESAFVDKSIIPSVDRSSKLAAVKKYTELEKKRAAVIQHSKSISNDREAAERELKELQIQQGRNELTDHAKETLYENEKKLKILIQQLQKEQRTKEEENEMLRKELEEFKRREKNPNHVQNSGFESTKSSSVESNVTEQQVIDESKSIPSTPNGTEFMDLSVPSSGSNLKRSRSSPNIAQLSQEAEQKHSVPLFDRNTKPVIQKPQPLDFINRNRNFHQVYGTVKPGLTGLKNLGNSCYMNSVLQCISNIIILNRYFCSGKYINDLNRSPQNPTRGEVAEEVAHVIRSLWIGEYRSIACRDLKAVVGKHMDQFRGCGQQDAHEFLTFLMDWLHNDLKVQREQHMREVKTVKSSDEKNGDVDAVTGAINAWNEFRSKNESIMLTGFFIQQVSTVQCSSCSVKSMNFEEPTSNLTLLLPSAARCSLLECLRLYTSKERITGYKCESCHGHHDAEKSVDLCRLPPILIIHLKRFYSDGFYQKRQTVVDFPLENLDMRQYTPNRHQSHTVYDLCGVSNHYGTLEGGHYTAYCRNGAKWYKFDDQDVSEIQREDVKSANAYILFYAAVR